ncbi:MAG TPA: ABC transporter ATP-binding protein, partial [Agromyces sp.]
MAAKDDLVVDARRVVKRFGDREVLRGVTLAVPASRIVVLMGPNGAGKSTLLQVLAGVRSRTSGQVRVLGAEPWSADSRWKERVGVQLQEATDLPEMSVRGAIRHFARYYTAPDRVDALVERFGLVAEQRTPVKRLSGGQRRRLDLALAFVGRPRLLLLDEPSAGLDVRSRMRLWSTLRDHRRVGGTVVMSSHSLREARAIADEVVLLRAGRVAASGSPTEVFHRSLARVA